jgi:hypothetical protein
MPSRGSVVRYPAFDDFETKTKWLKHFEQPGDAQDFIRAEITKGEGTLCDYGVIKTQTTTR